MYVKQLELTRFKSFGSTTTIPLLPGFTVVSGPNGSGKSNIIDAILFALGLSSSRGMRAERLPDLVHSSSLDKSRGRRRMETSVAVTFAIPRPDGEALDWKVTRRLRVNTGTDSYTSTYYVNDVPCTLTELHEQLSEMHIYPDGYNVVLQGDVTGIISMNAKERRQIIDELAGVANFDRKIVQAKDKLEAVREQEERSHLVMRELEEQSERLTREREKAENYRQLRSHLEELALWQIELNQRHIRTQLDQTRLEIEAAKQAETAASQALEELQKAIAADETVLAELNQAVRQLGEAEYLDLQSQLAQAQARQQQQHSQMDAWTQERTAALESIAAAEGRIGELEAEAEALTAATRQLEARRPELEAQQQQRQQFLEDCRAQMQAIAQSSDAWAKQHRYISSQLEENRALAAPYEQGQIRLSERLQQLERQQQDCQAEIEQLEAWLEAHAGEAQTLAETNTAVELEVQQLGQRLADLQAALDLDTATAERLQTEWQTQQRRLDKLETRQQVLQEAQGSRAAKAILNSDMSGICGLVAQLGQVDPRYQLALEIAAGSRLNFIVVETDEVAARAIAFLKRQQLGRSTFLPLNKLKECRPLSPLRLPGAIDYAVNLVEFESRFRDVFGFVFGQTIIFDTLDRARSHIGQHRIVTVDGDLLETSGAMTGGSNQQRQSVHFAASESAEIASVKQRYDELTELLETLTPRIKAQQAELRELTAAFNAARDRARATGSQHQHQASTVQSRQERLDLLCRTLQQHQVEAEQSRIELARCEQELEPLRDRIRDLAEKLQQLEESSLNQRWQTAQTAVQEAEAVLNESTIALRQLEQQRQEQQTQQQLNREKVQQQRDRIRELQERATQLQQQCEVMQQQAIALQTEIAQLEEQIEVLSQRLQETRTKRDQQELQVRSRQQQAQRLEWDCHAAVTKQQEKAELLEHLQQQLKELAPELPDPPPEIPADLTLEGLQDRIRRTESKLRSLEPVNMLAIEEYEATQARLSDLREKLETLQQERTELLLRIENFTTLRTQAFMEAYTAVDEHFREIFARLSDGDGQLQLENPEDPLSGGLTLIAHPKGKPVRRLNSMSGGEKSLTALSFIFALQRFRPSSFYALDEVDAFLDGANVEKLAVLVQSNADRAQFVVVSHRRPMIEKSERIIGVTQAPGAQTQVIGLKNTPAAGVQQEVAIASH
jgi:chromosome segregation protein